MADLFEYTSYRTYLKDELSRRVSKNRSYSLRAMARSFEMAPSMLSDVLKGKKNVSFENAYLIARKLDLNPTEAEYFSLLVQRDSAKKAETRTVIESKIRAVCPRRSTSKPLEMDEFTEISAWYHIPLVELLGANPTLSIPHAAHRLGISTQEAQSAVDRLIKVGLLEKDEKGNWNKRQDHFLVISKKPSSSLIAYHQQMHRKGIESLDWLGPDNQTMGTETFAMNKKTLAAAHNLVDEFLSRLAQLSKQSEPKTDVFHVMVHLFNLTPNPEIQKNPQ